MTGWTCTSKAEIAANLEKVYNYFPRLKTRRTSQAAYTSAASSRCAPLAARLMANPSTVLLDEPSMAGATDRGRGVQHRQRPEHQGEGHLLAGPAEHQHGARSTRTTATSWK